MANVIGYLLTNAVSELEQGFVTESLLEAWWQVCI